MWVVFVDTNLAPIFAKETISVSILERVYKKSHILFSIFFETKIYETIFIAFESRNFL